MIYLDNAATSFPKPKPVYSAIERTMKKQGGSPSRASHKLANAATEAVYSCRQAAGEFFGCEAESVVLTFNATHALNLAIKGLCEAGSHILISDMEHNSVLRPVHALTVTKTCSYDVYPSCGGDADAVIEGIKSKLRPDTRMLVANHASNICGIRLPIERIGEFCREHDIIFIVDLSQSAGHIPVNVSSLKADAVCMSGHKGLFGPQGTGLLILPGNRSIETLVEGGSGVDSTSPDMPHSLPERLEAGTYSAPLAAGLAAGIKWLQKTGIETVASHERRLSSLLCEYLDDMKGVTVFDREHVSAGGTVLFSVDGMSPAAVGKILDDCEICVRSGLHCAPLAHKCLKTGEDGAVRVSFSYFNTVSDVRQLALSLHCITDRV